MRVGIIILILLFSLEMKGQIIDSASVGMDTVMGAERASMAVYLNFTGPENNFSIAYDRRLTKGFNGIGFSGGFGLVSENQKIGFFIPFSVNYLFGNRNHFWELGFTGTYNSRPLTNLSGNGFTQSNYYYSIYSGYRKQPSRGGLIFRIGPIVHFRPGIRTTAAYISLGKNF